MNRLLPLLLPARLGRLGRPFLLPLCLLAALCFFAVPAAEVSAHAVLERSSPEPGSRLEAAPAAVELAFNEAIEANVRGLQVLDSTSEPVTKARAKLSRDRTTLTLPLPGLGEGVYTVSYHVISGDGHPVNGSYVFVVGNPPEAKDASLFNLHEQLGHSGHGAYGVPTTLPGGTLAIYFVRSLYYLSLLLAAGLVLWMVPVRKHGSSACRLYDLLGLWLTRALLVAVLLYVFVHARELLEGEPQSEWKRLFTGTSIGYVWDGMLLLALIGYPALKAGRWAGALWALAFLGLESYSGHAAAYDPKPLLLAIDFLHLAASAVWAGGLALLLALWLADREASRTFAPQFSFAAWVSILLLTLTGAAETLLFLPKPAYLFYTGWGTLLLVKTGLVLAAIATGFFLRRSARRRAVPPGGLLKTDTVLMTLIVIVAALFTYISPLPANRPVSAHLMGDTLHYTLRVTPNVPGENEIVLKVWLPEETGKPKAVALNFHSLDKPELGPIAIPLTPYEDKELDAFTGFVEADYEAAGPFIPFAGKWRAEIRIVDPADNETVHEELFRNY